MTVVAKKIKSSSPKKSKSVLRSSAVPQTYVRVERPIYYVGKRLSSYRVHFKDLDGEKRAVDIPRKAFSAKGATEAINMLLDEHAKMPISREDQKEALLEALEAMGNAPTLKITDRVGWSSADSQMASFVYYNKTYGLERDKLQLDTDSSRNPALGQRAGTTEKWRDGLEEPCRSADHLVLAIAIAASGPLYGIVGNPEPAIYHFQGAHKPKGDDRKYQSSSGKTLSARCAQSAFGACSRTDLFGFNMTALAMEETCFSCNNLLVVLDEDGAAGDGGGPHMIKPDVLPYRIVGGQGKIRSKAYMVGNGLSNRSWVVPVITTSENGLDTVRKEGAQVRMVPIPFPPQFEGGMFRTVDSAAERNRLAKLVEDTIAANYGVVMPKFLAHLVKDRIALAVEIPAVRDKFVQDVGAASSIWEKRYAEKFGIILAAALLLVRYGIAPWTEARAVAAVTELYKESRSAVVSVPKATNAVLGRLQNLVAKKLRFPALPKGKELSAKQKKKAWGIVRQIGGKKGVTLVPMYRFERLVDPPAVAPAVLKELAARGRLIKDPTGKILTRQVQITGLTDQRARYVCIKGLLAGVA